MRVRRKGPERLLRHQPTLNSFQRRATSRLRTSFTANMSGEGYSSSTLNEVHTFPALSCPQFSLSGTCAFLCIAIAMYVGPEIGGFEMEVSQDRKKAGEDGLQLMLALVFRIFAFAGSGVNIPRFGPATFNLANAPRLACWRFRNGSVCV